MSHVPVEYERIVSDARFAIETCFKIRSETKGIVPFVFNPAQSAYWEAMTNRDLILKARRLGFSTLKLAQGLHKCLTRPGYVAVIITHTPMAAMKMFEDLKVIYNNLPEFLKLRAGINNRTELTFPEIDSGIYITPAGKDRETAEAIGRSGTINFLHCSEYAFWRLPKLTMTAVSPCVPLPGAGGVVSIETTANGFNDLWLKWKNAKSSVDVYKPHFFPWWKDPKCKLPLLPEEREILLSKKHPSRLTPTELRLLRKYELSLEQIKWRRFKIHELPHGTFPQEYPANDVECFLQSGRPFFNVVVVKRMIDHVNLQPKTRFEDGAKVPLGWKIYKTPLQQRGRKHSGGVDCAEGLEDGDADDVTLLDKITGEQVLHLNGSFGPKSLARQVAHAHFLYRDCLWGVERNQTGHAVLSTLLGEEGMPKKSIYHHVNWDDRRRRSSRPGWVTDGKSRPIALAELDEAIERNYIGLHDPEQLQEFLTFVVGTGGKPKAQAGSMDDGVMSAAIAWQMRKSKPYEMVGWS